MAGEEDSHIDRTQEFVIRTASLFAPYFGVFGGLWGYIRQI